MDAIKGTGVALVTPFREDLSVDTDALSAIVEHCINGGVDYLVVLGTTGETATLTGQEKELVISTVVSTNNGRLPLVVGIGGNNTAALVDELNGYDLSPFSAVLSVSPYYNKPTQEGIYRHYKALAKVSNKPLILYNVPGRTASNILPETVFRIATDCPNVIGIKEAAGDLDQLQALISGRPEGFMVISGDDITALHTVLMGGEGVISVIGQGIPEAFTRLIRAGMQGDEKTANTLLDQLKEGMELIFEEGNPAGIKSILTYLGYCKPYVRLPLVRATEALSEKITRFTKRVVELPV